MGVGPADGPATFALEERKAADGSLVRAAGLGTLRPSGALPALFLSPGARALVMYATPSAPPEAVSVNLAVFD